MSEMPKISFGPVAITFGYSLLPGNVLLIKKVRPVLNHEIGRLLSFLYGYMNHFYIFNLDICLENVFPARKRDKR